MTKKAKTLTTQVKELAERLEILEAALGEKIKSKVRYENSQDRNHICCLPERQFDTVVSPTLERLI